MVLNWQLLNENIIGKLFHYVRLITDAVAFLKSSLIQKQQNPCRTRSIAESVGMCLLRLQ